MERNGALPPGARTISILLYVSTGETRPPGAPNLHLCAIKTVTATSVSLGHLRRKLGAEVPPEVILRRDQTGRVVHFDLQVGKRIQQRRVGHGDFFGDVVKGVHRAAVHGCRVRQVRGRRQQISWNQKKTRKKVNNWQGMRQVHEG